MKIIYKKMTALKFILSIILIMIALVRSDEEDKRLEFLIEVACKNKGEKCSDSDPCCGGLTCSEFKICRN